MISTDVKASVKQEIKRSGSCILNIFIRSIYLQMSKLDMQCKKGVYLSFDFVWCSIELDIVCY